MCRFASLDIVFGFESGFLCGLFGDGKCCIEDFDLGNVAGEKVIERLLRTQRPARRRVQCLGSARG